MFSFFFENEYLSSCDGKLELIKDRNLAFTVGSTLLLVRLVAVETA